MTQTTTHQLRKQNGNKNQSILVPITLELSTLLETPESLR